MVKRFINNIIGHKNLVMVIGLVLALIVIIILLITIPDKNIVLNNISDINQDTYIIQDTDKLSTILEDINKSEIEVVSNINNSQADVILETIGVDVNDLYSYAAAIDSRKESVNTIAILRPKEDKKQDIKDKLVNYLYEKQLYYIENNLTELEQYKDVQNGTVSSVGDYLIIVLHSNQDSIMQNIKTELANKDLLGVVTVAGTEDMYK